MTSESISKFNYISELQAKQVGPKIGIADSSTASFPSISSGLGRRALYRGRSLLLNT
jgi:hypothetical protein